MSSTRYPQEFYPSLLREIKDLPEEEANYLAAFIDGNTPDDMGYYFYSFPKSYDLIDLIRKIKGPEIAERIKNIRHYQIQLIPSPEDENHSEVILVFSNFDEGGDAVEIEIDFKMEVALDIIRAYLREGRSPGGCGGAWTLTSYGIDVEEDFERDYPLEHPTIMRDLLFEARAKKDSKRGRRERARSDA